MTFPQVRIEPDKYALSEQNQKHAFMTHVYTDAISAIKESRALARDPLKTKALAWLNEAQADLDNRLLRII